MYTVMSCAGRGFFPALTTTLRQASGALTFWTHEYPRQKDGSGSFLYSAAKLRTDPSLRSADTLRQFERGSRYHVFSLEKDLRFQCGQGLDIPDLCGDGMPEEWEQCDDGNTDSGDGCSTECSVEPSYSCIKSPTMCVELLTSSSFVGGGGLATTNNEPYAVEIEDLDANGTLDVVVANNISGTVSVFLKNGNGTYAPKAEYTTDNFFSRSVAIGDMTGDGKPDLAVTHANGIVIFKNNGSGIFATKTNYVGGHGSSIAMGDLNNDGAKDLAVSVIGSLVSVYLNNGDGTLATKTDYAVGQMPNSVTMGDVNGDGAADLVVGSRDHGNVAVLLNNGNGAFAAMKTYGTGYGPLSHALGDLNGDGWPDIAVANSSNNSNSISTLFNNGDGTFAPKIDYPVGIYPFVIRIGDMNNDGAMDLVVLNSLSKSVSILLNYGNGLFAPKADIINSADLLFALAVKNLNGDDTLDIVMTRANTFFGSVSMLLQAPLAP